MSPSHYESFAQAISEAGFFTSGIEEKGKWSRTCVASIRRPWGLTGNSFWVTVLDEVWYFGTWGCSLYRLDDSRRAVEFCVAWLKHQPSPTAAHFDPAFVKEFGLIQMSDEEFERLTS